MYKEVSHEKLEINNERQLKEFYNLKRKDILERLRDFKNVWNQDGNKIFVELCFCISTPQSKAEVCNEIIGQLERNRLLFKGEVNKIMPYLKKARFYKKKSRNIVEARKFFQDNSKIKLKGRLDIHNIKATREWLVGNIKGIGYKEASHFLRNIGLGENIAILDIHILRNLKKFGVISDIPKSISKKMYLDIENKFEKFSDRIKIPMAHLDLLFWSAATGKIFK
jgi:N-glycosylase/DNA lyase